MFETCLTTLAGLSASCSQYVWGVGRPRTGSDAVIQTSPHFSRDAEPGSFQQHQRAEWRTEQLTVRRTARKTLTGGEGCSFAVFPLISSKPKENKPFQQE
uniref:Uncharacterized protein n=1 Tax=Timema poppense TaxID=170557 RepID=A0A7R9GVP9_TIMPO|nr:unnamed protein product [Timema poppensis]